jgi:hypothetical protein
MRRIGSTLMALGALVGVGTGIAVLGNVHIPGVESWLVAVAVTKLGFAAGFSLIAVGALLRRAAARREGGRVSVESSTRPPLPAGVPAAEPVTQHDPAPTPRARL